MSTKSNLKQRVQHEAKSFVVIFLYVWAFVSLFAMHKAFVLERNPFSDQLLAIINAAVLAKVIITLEFFKVGEILPNRSPIFRILAKAVIFGLLLLMFRVLESGIKSWFHGRTFSQALAEVDGGRLMEMITLAVMMAVALLPYLIIREIIRAVGEQKLLAILFRPPTSTAPPQSE